MKLTAKQIMDSLREGKIQPIKDGAHFILITDGKHFTSSVEGMGANIVELLLNLMFHDPDYAILIKGTLREYEKIQKFSEATEKAIGHMDNIIDSLDKLIKSLPKEKPSRNRRNKSYGS